PARHRAHSAHPAQRDQDPAAEPGDRLRDREHLRRRGAVGGPYPLRHPGTALSQRKALEILRAARDVMERALAAGGTSFDALYVDVEGRSGYFARSLHSYGR